MKLIPAALLPKVMLFCRAARGLALEAVKYANRATRFAAKAPMIAKFQALNCQIPLDISTGT
jgi:hypothetical protein